MISQGSKVITWDIRKGISNVMSVRCFIHSLLNSDGVLLESFSRQSNIFEAAIACFTLNG